MSGSRRRGNVDAGQRVICHDGVWWLVDARGMFIERWRETRKYVVLDRGNQPSRRVRA